MNTGLLRLLSRTLLLSFAVVAFSQAEQVIAITAVTNSADFQRGLPQKGSLASIFTTGLEGEPGILTAIQYPLSNTLGGISVWVNFLPAPVFSIAFDKSYQQINVQVPWEGLREPLYVEVFQNGKRAHTEDTGAEEFSVFFSDSNGYAVAQHSAGYSLVTPQNPARPGEYLTVYALNLGPVSDTPLSGAPAPSNPPSVAAPPGSAKDGVCAMTDTIVVGSDQVSPSYVGLVPGSAGVYQVNFQVPMTAVTGDMPLVLVRTLTVNPFGPCHGSGLGNSSSSRTSRSVRLPVRR